MLLIPIIQYASHKKLFLQDGGVVWNEIGDEFKS